MAKKEVNSVAYDAAHIIQTEADLEAKTATVKNVVTGEEYTGGGGGGGSLITQIVNGQLDKTVGEIYEAFIAGQAVILKFNTSESDPYLGNYGILENMRIEFYENWSVTIQFNGAYFYTNGESTREALFAQYPILSD